MRAGRIRQLPLPLMLHQMIGPLATHMLFRPAMAPTLGPDLPDLPAACAVFADSFLRAVAVTDPGTAPTTSLTS